jgi:hypothetical protein
MHNNQPHKTEFKDKSAVKRKEKVKQQYCISGY